MKMNLKDIKTPDLLQMLANAKITYAECGGHHKASMNEMRVRDYKEELVSRGVAIPANYELYKVGVFNGDGAY